MDFYVKDNFGYVSIHKNGSSTFGPLLLGNGWKEIVNLNFDQLDNFLKEKQLTLWGHISDPRIRHTKGVAEYLTIHKIEHLIENESVGRMLASGAFDTHSYSILNLLGPLRNYPIHWIPLDVTITRWNKYPVPIAELNSDDLTNDFFAEQGIDLMVSSADRRWTLKSRPSGKYSVDFLRNKIDEYKQRYKKEYDEFLYNMLEYDLQLYEQTVAKFRKKYLDV